MSTRKVDSEIQGLLALRADPVLFVTNILGVKQVEPWQVDFLRAVNTDKRIAVRSGHGVGKTSALAWLILWFLSIWHPVKVGVTGPSLPTLQTTLWAELGSWARIALMIGV